MAAVSILMPVYNGAKGGLDKALESLCSQTLRDMKVIVSDNASTDETGDIIKAWAEKDPRITYHRQPENIGVFANFTWVMNKAQSKWVMFASHDDWWSPSYVEELYKVTQTHPDIQLAGGMMTLVRPDDTSYDCRYEEHINGLRGLQRRINTVLRTHIGVFYGLYDREALLPAWNASHEFKHAWGRDWLIILPFLLSARIAGSNAAIYYKRETELSVIRYRPKTLETQFQLFREFLVMALRIVNKTPMPFLHRIVMTPLMIIYTSRHAWRIKRLIVGALKAVTIGPFKKKTV